MRPEIFKTTEIQIGVEGNKITASSDNDMVLQDAFVKVKLSELVGLQIGDKVSFEPNDWEMFEEDNQVKYKIEIPRQDDSSYLLDITDENNEKVTIDKIIKNTDKITFVSTVNFNMKITIVE